MKLYIDTSDREKIVLKLDEEVFETSSKEEKSQKLLGFIDEILKSKGKSLKDLKEIEVNIGPGSFTGLRIGVSVANTLGWFLGIPVNGSSVKKGEVTEIIYK